MERCGHVSNFVIYSCMTDIKINNSPYSILFTCQICRILSEVTLEVFQRAGLSSSDESTKELTRNATLNVHHVEALGNISRYYKMV